MLHRAWIPVGALGLTLALAVGLPAQQRGAGSSRTGSTTSGLFGSRSIGGNLQPGSNSLFGSGNRSTGSTTEGVQSSTVTGSERFISANRDYTQSFVGADAGEVRNLGAGGNSSTQGLQGMRGLQNAFRQFNQFDQFRQFNQNNFGQNARTPVRIGLTLGFTPPAPATTTQTSAVVADRLTSLPGVNLVGSPQVLIAGRTAVVRGTAASERDRELVSRLLLLEPGISSVQNEMTIAQSGADPGSSPSSPPDAASSGSLPSPPRS